MDYCTNQKILTNEVIKGINDAINHYVTWQGGISPSSFDITNAEKAFAYTRLLRLLENAASSECIKQVVHYINEIKKSKTVRQATSLTLPSIIAMNSKSTKGNSDSANQQRTFRQIIRALFELDCIELGSKISWLSKVKIDVGIIKRISCPACGCEAELHIRSRTQGLFQCSSCLHSFEYPLNEIASRCKCSFCNSAREKMLQEIRSVIHENESVSLQSAQQHANSLLDKTSKIPLKQQMLRDYELNKNNANKDLRAILSLKPASAADFEKCLKQYVDVHNKSENRIIDSALKAKVLYSCADDPKVTGLHEKSSVHDLLAASAKLNCKFIDGSGGRWIDTKNNSADINAIFNLLFHVDINNVTDILCIVEDCLCLKVGNEAIQIFGGMHGIENTCIHVTRNHRLYLNPFFIEEQSHVKASQKPIPNSLAKSLFRSNTERNASERLLNEHSDVYVIPNRLLRQVIDLTKIKQHIQEEFTYLYNCEVDFAVYDRDGNLLFVEEVQRGDHHNDLQWIQKDAMKRKALAIAGVKFVESF